MATVLAAPLLGATATAAGAATTPGAGPAIVTQSVGNAAHTPDQANPRVAIALAKAPDAGQQVVTWAGQHGLHVVSWSTGVVTVTGSSSAVARAMGSATNPSVPAEIAEAATGAGSDTAAIRMHPIGLEKRQLPTGTQTSHALAGYGRAKLQAAYDVTGTGAGETIATVQFSGFTSTDLTDYSAASGLPLAAGQMTEVSVDSASLTASPTDEPSLDAEALLAMDPSAKQVMYIAPNTAAAEIDVYTQVAADVATRHLTAVSVSWGQCEAQVAAYPSFRSAVESELAQIVAEGATLFASTGDDGPYDCGDGTTLSTDWPATSPDAVAAGGTSLSGATAGPFTEVAWEYPSGSCTGTDPSGGGGGTSTFEPRPSWQSGLSISGSFRLVPDIAMEADPCTGPEMCFSGCDWTGGGTSLAAPLAAGSLVDELSEQSATSGIGDIHSALYAAPGSAFRDIVSGTYSPYAAGPGYDELTGRGSPQWDTLMATLTPPAVVGQPFQALSPTRILDTRTTNVPSGWTPDTPVGNKATLVLPVAGTSGVPSNATAVVANVTATNATVGTFITTYPTGGTLPVVSSLNVAAHYQAIPNLVTVKIGTGGDISLYNGAGSVDLIVDVVGYYAPAAPDEFVSLAPVRALDTRTTNVPSGWTPDTPVGGGGTLVLPLAGHNGVPANAAAVALNVTATNQTTSTVVTAYPDGVALPLASNLNPQAGVNEANMVIVPLGSGKIDLRNLLGSVDLIVDVVGYFVPTGGDTFVAVSPQRLLDTRTSNVPSSWTPDTPVGPGATLVLHVTGVAGVPTDADGVVINVTLVTPTGYTYETTFPTGTTRPTASSLNANPGTVIPNLVTAKVGTGGDISLFNFVGSTDMVVDIVGYYSPPPG